MFKLYYSTRLIKVFAVLELFFLAYFAMNAPRTVPKVLIELYDSFYPLATNFNFQLIDNIISPFAVILLFSGLILILLDKFIPAKWLLLLSTLISSSLILIERPFIVYGLPLLAKQLSAIILGVILGILFFPKADGALVKLDDI